jgi:uncharacterized protein (TIGR02145 family)
MNIRKHFMITSMCFLLTVRFLFSQIVLQGTVTDNGGEYLGSGAEPVVNALVIVTDQSDAGRFFSAYTNEQGQYTFQITQTGVDDDPSVTPGHFTLFQNYPNPFNPSTVICYELSQPCRVTIDIYNVLGQKIITLLNDFQSSSGQVVWYATDANNQGVPAGLYIYSMKAGDVRINRKMLLIDGQQSNAPAAPVIQPGSAITSMNVLNKQLSDQYTLQVAGEDIETYEQHNLEITGDMNFNVIVTRIVTDIDRNVYHMVKIGNQWWMAENLKVTHYRNGDSIPNVTDNTAWSGLSSGALCVFDNSEINADTYGYLYNWYAVNDIRNIAPAGWHVPTDEEWKTLEKYLGMSQSEADVTGWRGTDEGGKLKETGTAHWSSPNIGATNSSGYTALPGGFRYDNGDFSSLGVNAYFWSSTGDDYDGVWILRDLDYYSSGIYRDYYDYYYKHYGFSVRLLKD